MQRKDIDLARGFYNEHLKKIGKELGIIEPLTSYVARHTWADTARNMSIPKEIIGESLGHSDLKTTDIYLSDFVNEVLDDVNKKVIE